MNYENVDFEKVQEDFESVMGFEKEDGYNSDSSIHDILFCNDCEEYKILEDVYMVCPICGNIDLDPVIDSVEYIQKKSFYKRILYCIEKLNLMTCYKRCTSIFYKEMIDVLKDEDFETITELRDIMKKYKYNKYYKHIYNVYNDIKKKRLIILSPMIIFKISKKFAEIEYEFKKNSDKHGRKNFLSYNSTIWILLKRMKNKGYKHILVPNNHDHIVKIFKSFNI